MNMKKKLTIVLVITLSLIYLLTSNVLGYSFKTELVPDTSSTTVGSTITVKIKLSGIDAGKGLFNFSGILNYDTEVFEEVTSNDIVASTSNGWSVTYTADTKKILLECSNWVTTDQEIATITLRVKSDATATSATVGLGDIVAAHESGEIKGSDISTIISISEGGGQITPQSENEIPVIEPNTTGEENFINEVTNIIEENNTSSNDIVPYAGAEDYVLPLIAVVIMLAIISFVNYKRLDGKE